MATRAPGWERFGLTLLWAGSAAPFAAQVVWRPLGHVFGLTGGATVVSCGAVGVATATGLLHAWSGPRARWFAVVLALGLAYAASLGVAGAVALVAVAVGSAGLFQLLPTRLPESLDGLARARPGLATLYVLVALVTLVSVARVSVFAGDPIAVDLQAIPGEKFTETHSCLSAYVRASQLARAGAENLYADAWWAGSRGLPALPEGAVDPWKPFELDNFSYPPPFLLVAAVLAPLDGDFFAQRSLWFGLNGLVAAVGLGWVAAAVARSSATHGHRVALLAPLLLGSVPFLVVFQVGNFHVVAVVLSVAALVAADRGRPAVTGALLALTTLSKISPGLLGIFLLRRRAAVVATLVAAVLLLALSTVSFGTAPLQDFVRYALPRLSSGRAFPFMDTPAGIATNLAPFGFAFKLDRLGVTLGDPWRIAPWIARGYTVALAGIAALGARRTAGDPRVQALRWMGLSTLAAMQSPFSPAYATVALLWATTLLSVEVRRWRDGVLLVAVWPAILAAPSGGGAASLATSMAQTAVIIGLSTWLVLRPAPSETP